MGQPPMSMLRIGEWRVDARSGQISRNGETARLDERAMRLLLCLAARPGEVVSIDHLLNEVWSGVSVSPDSVYQAIATLRRQLGDDPRQPAYIATVPRLGYRLVAAAGPVSDEAPPVPRRPRAPLLWVFGVAAACLLVVLGLLFVNRGPLSRGRLRSIAVLPFVDLTEHMAEEEFADGVTEELIDKLSGAPGLRVPSATSAFYFKNKHVAAADIAQALGVAYILDGSVRRSGERVRIAARLFRPSNGYVLWTGTYDRPWGDAVKVQDEIAGEVTKALKASIRAASQ